VRKIVTLFDTSSKCNYYDPEDSQRLKPVCWKQQRFYRNTKAEELRSFQSLESSTTKVLEQVSPKLLFFYEITGTDKGRARIVKSVVGKVTLTDRQAKILGLKPYSQLSPLFEKTACY